MSTRWILAKQIDSDGWEGRYVHSDGYLEGALPTIAKGVEILGYEKFMNLIMAERVGWSSLPWPSQENLETAWNSDPSWIEIGDRDYSSNEAQPPQSYTVRGEDGELIFRHDQDTADCEYLYIVTPTGVLYSSLYDPDNLSGFWAWGDEIPSWK